MELTWELDSLYPSFQSEKYRRTEGFWQNIQSV